MTYSLFLSICAPNRTVLVSPLPLILQRNALMRAGERVRVAATRRFRHYEHREESRPAQAIMRAEQWILRWAQDDEPDLSAVYTENKSLTEIGDGSLLAHFSNGSATRS